MGEQRLRAAQVARALLARGRDEDNRRARAERGAIDDARECEHRREAAAVVADAGAEQTQTIALHAETHGAGKHSIEVRADDHWRLARRALTSADDVSRLVCVNAGEAELAESRGHPLPALLLLAGWRRDLGDGDLRVDQLGVAHRDRGTRVRELGRIPHCAEPGGYVHGS